MVRYAGGLMAQRIVVVGSAGQLGVELVREFSARGYPVAGLDRSTVDITDEFKTEQAIAALEPAVVLNAAAYNQVDLAEAEPLNAFMVNGLGVRNLALACRQSGARLVQFSTDYVFDGETSLPYVEEDPPHPLCAYGVSKLAGEAFARAYLDDVLIIRTSGVYGPGGLKNNRGNFVELMLRMAAEKKTIRLVEDFVGSPTFAPLLAARTADLVERRAAGLFHIGGGAPISWFDFAKRIFAVAGIKRPALQAVSEREYRAAARRPKYTALSNRKMERLGLPPMPPVDDALKMYFAERTLQTR
jgi:dTDP-4-dehydrorhamnose reductase